MLTEVNYNVQQAYQDTCAIKAQQIILENHGLSFTEDELRLEAIKNGWYKSGEGTPLYYSDQLLNLHGIQTDMSVNNSVSDIAHEIAVGNQVIVGVDSGELWGTDALHEDWFMGEEADHAVLVNGFMVDPFSGQEEVLITDPGTGDVLRTYPVSLFEESWEDSDCFMIVTE